MDSNSLHPATRATPTAYPQRWAAGFVTIVVAALGSACSSSKSTSTITTDELNLRLAQERVLIIDTRDTNLFDAGRINAGGSISVVDMEDGLKDAAKDELIAVCGAGPEDPSPAPVAATLRQRG